MVVSNFSLKSSECIFFKARSEFKAAKLKREETTGGCEKDPFPSLFLLQEVLWLEVPSSILDFIYVFSLCERCSLQPGVLFRGGGTFKVFSLAWNYVVI